MILLRLWLLKDPALFLERTRISVRRASSLSTSLTIISAYLFSVCPSSFFSSLLAKPPREVSGFLISCATFAAISPRAASFSDCRSLSWVSFNSRWASLISEYKREFSIASPAWLANIVRKRISSSVIGLLLKQLSTIITPTTFPDAISGTEAKVDRPSFSESSLLIVCPSSSVATLKDLCSLTVLATIHDESRGSLMVLAISFSLEEGTLPSFI